MIAEDVSDSARHAPALTLLMPLRLTFDPALTYRLFRSSGLCSQPLGVGFTQANYKIKTEVVDAPLGEVSVLALDGTTSPLFNGSRCLRLCSRSNLQPTAKVENILEAVHFRNRWLLYFINHVPQSVEH